MLELSLVLLEKKKVEPLVKLDHGSIDLIFNHQEITVFLYHSTAVSGIENARRMVASITKTFLLPER